ncbi:3-keto-disaccharide hydrolase [Terriglobus roseus]|uniref:3-keto-alpha-glucoside-1,2-lyase/3-keto-2-hydroxy-glucal hydratase domain-containing protein n=1 Tax=Terriglobus roseus TaxID=392734 RepID=A0A1G7F9P9_9BACT|nr:DUF1080 domain-containing protein [Terriglobus roseus]SDE72601.1 protein of unknown function [Terriglobus roseus]
MLLAMMKYLAACVLACSLAVLPATAQKMNTLTAKEKADGWKLLFDGKTTNGWRSARGGGFPATGWAVQDGTITVTETGGEEAGNGGDIVTDRTYSNFELSVDFKTSPGANSGIMYFVNLDLMPWKNGHGSPIGFEYQILDDALHPDAKRGKDGDRTVASLYDMIPAAADKPIKPVGEWNTARIVVRGKHAEHWLNGVKVLEYDRDSPEFKAILAGSKYHVFPQYGQEASGYLLLQDHGFPVWFRNIKIRELPADTR